MNPPAIVCPLSRTGDTVAGCTADEVALNLLAGTRIFLSLDIPNKLPTRPCPDIWTLFRGHALSPEGKKAVISVAAEWARFRRAAARAESQPTKRLPQSPAPVLVAAEEEA